MIKCRPLLYLLVLTTGIIFIGCSQAYPSKTASSLPASTPIPPVTSLLFNSTPTSVFEQPPGVSKTSLSACLQKTGTVKTFNIETSPVEKPVRGRIYFPPCYQETPAAPYPYLILLHGKLSTDDQWERLGITAAADQLITSGKIPPLLIVLPLENETSSNPLESDFGNTLIYKLVPWLQETYPLSRDRYCHAIGGLSRGAFWAYRIGLPNWQIFGAIGGHSLPNTQFTEYYFRDLVQTIPAGEMPRLYLDSGDRDIALKDAAVFEALLVKFGIAHTRQIYKGDHSESYWSAHVSDYLHWYADPWNSTCSQNTNP